MPELLAVCVVHELRHDAGTEGVTAIDKRPVHGPVRVGPFGLRGDVQASRKHHGGHDKALYVYGQDDADFWSQQLGRELAPGWFGENLRVSELDPTDARPGDRWHLGDRVVIEATMPRTPCATFARWVGGADARGWVKRFGAEARLGGYFRVVRGGEVRAGDPIEVEPLGTGPTLRDLFTSAAPAG